MKLYKNLDSHIELLAKVLEQFQEPFMNIIMYVT